MDFEKCKADLHLIYIFRCKEENSHSGFPNETHPMFNYNSTHLLTTKKRSK